MRIGHHTLQGNPFRRKTAQLISDYPSVRWSEAMLENMSSLLRDTIRMWLRRREALSPGGRAGAASPAFVLLGDAGGTRGPLKAVGATRP
jgi:hypothetical protein